MKRYIDLTKADREVIARAHRVTDRTVYNALHFERMNEGSDLIRKIRCHALKRGGVVMVEAPEMETIHDSAGYMRQYFPNGVVLEFSKEDGSCNVLVRGVSVKQYTKVKISDIDAIQREAMRMR